MGRDLKACRTVTALRASFIQWQILELTFAVCLVAVVRVMDPNLHMTFPGPREARFQGVPNAGVGRVLKDSRKAQTAFPSPREALFQGVLNVVGRGGSSWPPEL